MRERDIFSWVSSRTAGECSEASMRLASLIVEQDSCIVAEGIRGRGEEEGRRRGEVAVAGGIGGGLTEGAGCYIRGAWFCGQGYSEWTDLR